MCQIRTMIGYLGLAVNSYNNTGALFNRPAVLMADVIRNHKLPKDTKLHNVGEFTLELWRNTQRILVQR